MHDDAPRDDPGDDRGILTLTYTSSVTALMSVVELVELIEQIRPKNEGLGVTGLRPSVGGITHGDEAARTGDA